MKSKKIIYIVLIVLLTALLAADIGIRAFTPVTPSFSQRGDRQRPDFSQLPEGERPSFENMPNSGSRRNASPLSTVARYWIPIAAVCALGDALCIFLLVKSGKKKSQDSDADSMLPEDEDSDEPYRPNHSGYWTAALCAALAVVLLLTSVTPAAKDSVAANSKVLSGKTEVKTLSTVLSGTGTLTAAEAADVEIPAVVTVENYHVKNGDIVAEGDVIATVDSITVRAAVAELQSVIDALDYDLVLEKNKNPSSYVNASAAGRVKEIYAEVDTAVTDTVYQHGALMLLSLDGTMAVRISAQLTIGDSVTVTLSDGSTEKGRVIAYSDGISTVTISDKTAPCGDAVTVTDENGAALGSGTLFVHSPLKVVSYNGIVSRVNVKVNQSVSNGGTLLTLKDVGRTSKYTTLLGRRHELEDQMNDLIQMARDGKLRAQSAGIIRDLDEEIDYEPLAARSGSAAYTFIPLSNVNTQYKIMLLGDEDGGDDGDDDGSASISGVVAAYSDGFVTIEGYDEPIDISGCKIVFDPLDPDNEEGEEIEVGDSVMVMNGVVYVAKKQDAPDKPDKPDKPTDPTQPTMPDMPQTVTGIVSAVGKGSITIQTMAGPVEIKDNGQKVTIDGKPAKFSDITVGSTVTVTEKSITVKSGGNTPGMPDLSGMRGGFSFSFGSQKAEEPKVYDTYDLTKATVGTITPLNEVTVSILVDELDVLSLQEGMAANITLDAMTGKSFLGEITHIDQYGTNEGGNTKYTVEVTLPRTADMLEGMNASVKVTTSVSQPVSTLPAAALQEIGGKTYVYTAYDEKSDTLSGQVEVETGLSDGNMVEIRSGLDENTTFFYRYADSMQYSIG